MSRTVFDLAGMLLGWLRELLGREKLGLQRHQAVSKPEVGEAIEVMYEDEKARQ